MGDYGAYILAAYGVSVLSVGALIVFTALDARRQRRRLAALSGDAGRPAQ